MKFELLLKSLLIGIILLGDNVFAHEQAEDYRFNPFQFKLAEYYFKAEPEQIESISKLPKGFNEIKFEGYRFFIPETLKTKKFDENTLSIRDKNDTLMFYIDIKPKDLLLCKDAKNDLDYCSAFDTRRELLFKTYTLTPDDLSKDNYANKGHSWIVFYKGVSFEFVENIKIYRKDGFIFFRENNKPDIKPMNDIKTRITLSSPRDDELLTLIFPVKDESLIMNIIRSFHMEML